MTSIAFGNQPGTGQSSTKISKTKCNGFYQDSCRFPTAMFEYWMLYYWENNLFLLYISHSAGTIEPDLGSMLVTGRFWDIHRKYRNGLPQKIPAAIPSPIRIPSSKYPPANWPQEMENIHQKCGSYFSELGNSWLFPSPFALSKSTGNGFLQWTIYIYIYTHTSMYIYIYIYTRTFNCFNCSMWLVSYHHFCWLIYHNL